MPASITLNRAGWWNKFYSKLSSHHWASHLVALAAGLVYLIQSLGFAHSLPAILDEGTYLYKGYLFMTGKYMPFQEYGPWTNQMPLSFMVPGAVQALFGPGLRTGRYFSIALGLFMLLGLWIVTRRFAGRWWAAALLWVVAINPGVVAAYSQAVSQILVACLLVWMLVVALGEDRPVWQLLLGGFLAGLLMVIRVNMAPVLPLVIGYIYWQFGIKTTWKVALAGLLPVVLVHTFYWPEIMRLWVAWFPIKLTPFLNAWRLKDAGTTAYNPTISLRARWLSAWDGLRLNFVAVVAVFAFVPFLFRPARWNLESHRRVAVFLASLFILLLLMHAVASLGDNYCVSCFARYIDFFMPIGLLFLAIVYSACRFDQAPWLRWIVIGIFGISLLEAGYQNALGLGTWIANLPIPRFKEGRFVSGIAPLWSLLERGAGLGLRSAERVLSTLGWALLGIFFLILARYVVRKMMDKVEKGRIDYLMVSSSLLIGAIIAPQILNPDTDSAPGCTADRLASVEQVGSYLGQQILKGSKVYFESSFSFVPLLYLPDVQIYPAQINDVYSFHKGGTTQAIERYGFWNPELKKRWLQEADFIVIEAARYDKAWNPYLKSDLFTQLPPSPRADPCRPDSRFFLFRRATAQTSEIGGWSQSLSSRRPG